MIVWKKLSFEQHKLSHQKSNLRLLVCIARLIWRRCISQFSLSMTLLYQPKTVIVLYIVIFVNYWKTTYFFKIGSLTNTALSTTVIFLQTHLCRKWNECNRTTNTYFIQNIFVRIVIFFQNPTRLSTSILDMEQILKCIHSTVRTAASSDHDCYIENIPYRSWSADKSSVAFFFTFSVIFTCIFIDQSGIPFFIVHFDELSRWI